MLEHYRIQVSGSKLPQSMKDMLLAREYTTMDELGEAFHELIYMLEHVDYYNAIASYEKGTAMLEQEDRPAVQAKYRARLNELAIEIERLRSKGEAR